MNVEMLLNRTNHKIKLIKINNNFKANVPIKKSHLFLNFAEWVRDRRQDKEQDRGG